MTKDQVRANLQIQLLLSQLTALRRELRETIHAYEARLEISLAEVVNGLTALKTAKRFSSERIAQVDEMISLLRRRKLKPENGRRKDLHRIEDLIRDLKGP